MINTCQKEVKAGLRWSCKIYDHACIRTVCEDWVVSPKNTVKKREAHQKNILEWYLMKHFFWGKIKLNVLKENLGKKYWGLKLSYRIQQILYFDKEMIYIF